MQPDQAEAATEVARQLNHLVHGDPIGAIWNLVHTRGGGLGYGMGRVTDEPKFAD